jgi:hypothetical protein
VKWYSKNKITLRRIYIFFVTLGIDIRKTFYVIKNFSKFIKDLINFKKKGGKIRNIYPFFDDFNSEDMSFKNQFFHADLLIAQKIYKDNPQNHIDVGSRVDGLVSHIASFRNLDIADIRNINIEPHKNIKTTILNLGENKLSNKEKYFSISCVGVIGHVGLGRYGDDVDPQGHKKAIANLSNISETKGLIYIMVPVGKSGVEFNSHRVFEANEIIEIFRQNNCELTEFSLVDDFGELHINCEIKNSQNLNFGGGIFTFMKK